MIKKIVLGFLWLGFAFYTFWLSPLDNSNNLELLKNLTLIHWQGINPFVSSLFSFMGVWPLMYACILFADGRGQKIRAFPFFLGSNFVGIFALLPYLIFRQPNPTFIGKKDWLIRIFDARITGISLLVGSVGLLIFGLSQGDWQDFIQQWQTNRFIHTMSLDFCLLTLLFPILLPDDFKRREMNDSRLLGLITLVPLFGPLVYLCFRPHLPNELAIMEKPET